MSDVKLLRLTDGKAEELTGKPARLEKDLQDLIEANLESFSRVRMVASEYSTGKTHAGRIFAARTDYKQSLDEEICRKLLSLPAEVEPGTNDAPNLTALREAEITVRLGEIDTRNAQFFDEEVLKLDRWSEDLKLSIEHEIKELDKQIRELRRTAALAQSLEDKLAHQKQVRDVECRRNAKRRELFDAQDAIDQQREGLIGKIEKQLKHSSDTQALFTLRWRVA